MQVLVTAFGNYPRVHCLLQLDRQAISLTVDNFFEMMLGVPALTRQGFFGASSEGCSSASSTSEEFNVFDSEWLIAFGVVISSTLNRFRKSVEDSLSLTPI